MNVRLATALVGGLSLVLGLAGLLYPERVLGLLGFMVQNASHSAAALGEVRATYGGLFTVIGVYTLLSAVDPPAHRARLLLLGLLWLGAFTGRLVGVFADGNPGLFGWLPAAFELVMGGTLVVASGSSEPAPAGAQPPATVEPTHP